MPLEWTSARQTVKLYRVGQRLVHLAVASCLFYATIWFMKLDDAHHLWLGHPEVDIVAPVTAFSVGLIAFIRAIEGPFVIPRGAVTYRGSAAFVIAWLYCFGFVAAAAAVIGEIERLARAPRGDLELRNLAAPPPRQSPPSSDAVPAPPAAPVPSQHNSAGHPP